MVGALFSCCGYCSAAAADAVDRIHRLEAAFIYNFMKFTDWKDAAIMTGDAPLRIVVADGNPFGDALQPLTNRRVSGHAVQVSFEPDFLKLKKNIPPAQVVFVADKDLETVEQVVALLRHRHVLTVSDTPGFAAHGGCIELREKAGRMSFIINRKAVDEQDIALSYQVYNLAAEVLGVDK